MNHSQSILACEKTGSVLLLFSIVPETVNEPELPGTDVADFPIGIVIPTAPWDSISDGLTDFVAGNRSQALYPESARLEPNTKEPLYAVVAPLSRVTPISSTGSVLFSTACAQEEMIVHSDIPTKGVMTSVERCSALWCGLSP